MPELRFYLPSNTEADADYQCRCDNVPRVSDKVAFDFGQYTVSKVTWDFCSGKMAGSIVIIDMTN